MITTEKTIVGNLVGTYAELVELMALADRGLVKLHTQEYKLSAGQRRSCTTCIMAASTAARF